MSEREKLIELMAPSNLDFDEAAILAGHLLSGGVIVPQLDLGDTVWFIYDGKVIGAKIEEMRIDCSGKRKFWFYRWNAYSRKEKIEIEVTYSEARDGDKYFSDITMPNELSGKIADVFFTRKEAECALKGGACNG